MGSIYRRGEFSRQKLSSETTHPPLSHSFFSLFYFCLQGKADRNRVRRKFIWWGMRANQRYGDSSSLCNYLVNYGECVSTELRSQGALFLGNLN